MQKIINRQRLLEFFDLAQSKFDSSLEKAKHYEHEFETLRKFFMLRCNDHLENARDRIPDSNPLKQQIIGFIDFIEKTKFEWDAKIAGRKNGIEFRESFEDSLLVFVNGKVKSGKSSLGNYMAWGHTDPDDNLKRRVAPRLRPEYKSQENTAVSGGDSEHEAQKHKEFRVGATEATSSIQSFKLPGITWVDSPGMHSLKIENEKLARDYVEHADLILYTMKSDSPGRESDLTEIKHLLVKEKKLLILLTGSDDIEEDIDDVSDELVQTIVMKTPERCEKQRDYVRKALDEKCGAENTSNVEIVSLSVRYAQINAADPAAFRDSGMGLLCETLHHILQSDSVRIKQRKPITSMQNFMTSCHHDLQSYSKFLSSFKRSMDKIKRQSDKKITPHILYGNDKLRYFIEDFFDGITRCDDEYFVSKQLSFFQNKLNEEARKISFELLENFFEGLVLKKSTEAVMGGDFGEIIRKVADGSAGVNYRKIEVTVGDSSQDIFQKTILYGESFLEKQIIEVNKSLWGVIYKDVDSLLVKLNYEVSDFGKKLKQLQLKIESA